MLLLLVYRYCSNYRRCLGEDNLPILFTIDSLKDCLPASF